MKMLIIKKKTLSKLSFHVRSYFFKSMKMLIIKKKYIIKIIFSCEILFFQGYENVKY